MTIFQRTQKFEESARPVPVSGNSFVDLGLAGSKVLFVASTGGHLSEIERVARVVGASTNSALVTFESAQSMSIPWIDDVRFVDYVRPRDLVGTARAAKRIRRMLIDERWDAVVSTGAAVAVSALPIAAAVGVRSIYIESYARFSSPSRTGLILERAPRRIELYTQHRSWARKPWSYSGSILDSLEPVSRCERAQAKRVFVTLGTIAPFRFDALIDAVLRVAPMDAEFVWQVGCTGRTDLPGRVFEHLSQAEFDNVARESDVVISHAGVGTAIGLIELGHKPVLVPRRVGRGEHIDDHQTEIAEALASRGLALTFDASTLNGTTFVGTPV